MNMVSFGLAPVLLLAFLMGGPLGAIAALLGEIVLGLLSGSLTAGAIAGCIAGITCLIAGWLILKKNVKIWLAGIIAVIIYVLFNLGFVWYTLGIAAVKMTYLPILISAACNVAIAVILAYLFKKTVMGFIGKMMATKQPVGAAEMTEQSN